MGAHPSEEIYIDVRWLSETGGGKYYLEGKRIKYMKTITCAEKSQESGINGASIFPTVDSIWRIVSKQ